MRVAQGRPGLGARLATRVHTCGLGDTMVVVSVSAMANHHRARGRGMGDRGRGGDGVCHDYDEGRPRELHAHGGGCHVDELDHQDDHDVVESPLSPRRLLANTRCWAGTGLGRVLGCN